MGAIRFRIQLKPDHRTVVQVLGQVVEEKAPLLDFPDLVRIVAVKTDHVCGHVIELLSEIGQRDKGLNLANDAPDAKQVRELAEPADIGNVQPQNVMPQPLANVQEITGARPEIEYPLVPSKIDSQIQDPPDVRGEPPLHFQIFLHANTRIWNDVFRTDRLQFLRVNLLQQRRGCEWERAPLLRLDPLILVIPPEVTPELIVEIEEEAELSHKRDGSIKWLAG